MIGRSPNRVQFANTLRGMASISVLLAHYTGAFWSQNRGATAALIHAPVLPLSEYGFPIYLKWLHSMAPFDWGAFGVALFFLVSGFVITLSLRQTTWQAFVVGRFFRIVPLYMAGFSVTLIAIWLCGRYFGVPWPFTINEALVQYVPGPQLFLWLPSIDGIVWTLEVELLFYLVCALGIAWLRNLSVASFLLPLLIAAIGLYLSATVNEWISQPTAFHALLALQWVAPFLVFMFIGVALCFRHVGALKTAPACALISGLFLLFTVMTGRGQGIAGGGTIGWSYAAAVIVFALAMRFPNLFRSTKIGDFFADISYPLYVVHGVAGYAALRVLLDLGAKAWLSLILTTAGAMAIAWLLHVTIEVPSHSLGKRLARSLQGLRESAAIGAPAE